MSSFRNILLAPLSMIRTFFDNCGEFGPRIALYKALEIFVYHFPSTKMYKRFFTKMNSLIYNYLENNLADTINEYCSKEHTVDSTISPIIWQSWWQGENCLGGITKIATESVKKHLCGLSRVFITEDNYQEYVQIPQKILHWLSSGRISHTHFSDYLRMALLCQNGGIWFDCTIYLAKNLDTSFLKNSFYSTKGSTDYRYISLDMWSTSCMACAPAFPMMELYLKLYEAYFEKHNKLIDYYLTDFFMRIAYNHIPDVKQSVDSIQLNNPGKHLLTGTLNKEYNKEVTDELFATNTVFKLSRKMTLREYTKQGKVTLYGKLLEESLS